MLKTIKVIIFVILAIIFLNPILTIYKLKNSSINSFVFSYLLVSIDNLNQFLTNIDNFLLSLIFPNQLPTSSVTTRPALPGLNTVPLRTPEDLPTPTFPDLILPPPSTDQMGEIEGYVYGKTSTTTLKLADAIVEINNLRLRTYTNKDGYYIFKNIPYGFHVLTAQKKDFYPDSRQIKLNSYKVRVDFTLYSTENPSLKGTIEGYVKDKLTNQPIANADVEIDDYGDFWKVVRTNSSGYYRFNNISYGEYLITAKVDGYNTESKRIVLSSSNLRQDFLLEGSKIGEVKGIVKDKLTRQAIKGVRVNIRLDQGGFSKTAITDIFGNYIFKGLRYGNYTIDVEKEGYKSVVDFVNLFQPLVIKNFFLEPIEKGSIQGKVFDKITNQPIKNAFVELKGPISKSQQTGMDGKYIFTNLKEGEYEIVASKDGYISLTQSVDFKSSDNLIIDFQLEPAYLIFIGKVTDESLKPIDNAIIEIYLKNISDNIEVEEGWGITDRDGNYKIPLNLAFSEELKENYRAVIIAYRDGFNREKKESVITSHIVKTDFVLKKSSKTIVKGKVLDIDQRKPIENAAVYNSRNTSYSDKDGNYELETETGLQIISSWHKDYIQEIKEIYVSPEGIDNLDFYLKKKEIDLVKIIIYVLEKGTNKPITGAKVKNLDFNQSCYTDLNGECQIVNIPFYKNEGFQFYNFKITKDGYKPLITKVRTDMVYNKILVFLFHLEKEEDCDYANLEILFKNLLTLQIIDSDFLLKIEDLETGKVTSYILRDRGFFRLTIPFRPNEKIKSLKVTISGKDFKTQEKIISIRRCENKELSIYLEYNFYKEYNFDNVRFCIYGEDVENELKNNNYNILKKLASQLNEKRLKTGINYPECIFIKKATSLESAESYVFENKVVLDLKINYWMNIIYVLSHELGHIYDYQNDYLANKEPFYSYYKNALSLNCVFDRINDSSFVAGFKEAGHPDSNPQELFASAFHAFNDHQEEFLRRVNSAPDSRENSCQDILRKIYKYMEEKVFNKDRNYRIYQIKKYLTSNFNNIFNLFKNEVKAQVFYRYGSVYGFLTDINNKPISDAVVYIGIYYSAKTDKNGFFEIKNIPAGPYPFFVFDKNGYRLIDGRLSITVLVSPYRPTFLPLIGFYYVGSKIIPF